MCMCVNLCVWTQMEVVVLVVVLVVLVLVVIVLVGRPSSKQCASPVPGECSVLVDLARNSACDSFDRE